MKKEKLIQIRVSKEQYQKFKRFAESNDMTRSEIIRGFINKVIRKQ
jgi:antitoxin component of RelBE/YafQ-DinJ toxin-antitoxin module